MVNSLSHSSPLLSFPYKTALRSFLAPRTRTLTRAFRHDPERCSLRLPPGRCGSEGGARFNDTHRPKAAGDQRNGICTARLEFVAGGIRRMQSLAKLSFQTERCCSSMPFDDGNQSSLSYAAPSALWALSTATSAPRSSMRFASASLSSQRPRRDSRSSLLIIWTLTLARDHQIPDFRHARR